jgi:hypothetical protein
MRSIVIPGDLFLAKCTLFPTNMGDKPYLINSKTHIIFRCNHAGYAGSANSAGNRSPIPRLSNMEKFFIQFPVWSIIRHILHGDKP